MSKSWCMVMSFGARLLIFMLRAKLQRWTKAAPNFEGCIVLCVCVRVNRKSLCLYIFVYHQHLNGTSFQLCYSVLSTQIDRTDFSIALNHLFTTKISGNFSCPNGKKKVFGTWTCGSWAIWTKFTVWFGQREKSRGLCKIKSYAWRSCNAVRLKLLLIAIVDLFCVFAITFNAFWFSHR